MEDFLDAYVTGWSIPDPARESFKANVRPWLDEPDWSLYVAKLDGRPVGTAILFIHAGVGYFADSDRPCVSRAWNSCGIVESAPARRRRSRGRVRLQRGGFSIDQPPQHGAGRNAAAVPSSDMDAAGVSGALEGQGAE
jgi:hypothetical protein